MKPITFIGNGNMALSIAKGLKDNYDIEVVGRSTQSLDNFENQLGIKCSKVLYKDFDMDNKTVILCVKPANIAEVGKMLKGTANELYSVLAGTTLEQLKQNIKANLVVRTMPNLCANIGKSMTTLTGDIELKDKAIELFNSIGSTLWLATQKEIDIATAVAGSGPAYLALVHEALCDGAVKQGMKRADAIKVTNGLFNGFGELIPTIHSAILKDNVMSPGGTTAAGYSALEKGNVRSSCIDAIEQAYLVTQK
jgi:pyrroline-5-carboxylate reductase